MNGNSREFEVIVIGGGHAGVEAAWAAANLGASVAFVTMDPAKVGAMSCNPAIGGLAKGQMVREIDALGGLMGLAADATGIQFRVLNASKGAAVRGPRCQSDKYRYALEVQRMIARRAEITVIAGAVDDVIVADGRVTGVVVSPTVRRPAGRVPLAACLPMRGPADSGEPRHWQQAASGTREVKPAHFDSPYDRLEPHRQAVYFDQPTTLHARAVVLTTGTFMRGLMHTGETQTQGGRVGEAPAVGISAALTRLGFDLGRLKTGTPPRLAAETIDFASLELQPGDAQPIPFSDMTPPEAFPIQPQRPCHLTHTSESIHKLIRANLHRAPMYNGQIQTAGPRYCPSIEDKVVRFADRGSHHVFLEPESLDTNEIYCNGISTSLPADVQDYIVAHLPGCQRAKILRYGYAVEYDMVWPHQIDTTCMTKPVDGLFLAGQINGTSGYEEAAGQGLVAGLNAVRLARGREPLRLRRDQAYIGVMLDDLATKTPREPYRMFTSRAEHRLLLRADNADRRLTPAGRDWGLVGDARWSAFEARRTTADALRAEMARRRVDGQSLLDWARRPEVDAAALRARLNDGNNAPHLHAGPRPRILESLLADIQYAGYIDRQGREVQRMAAQEETVLPARMDYDRVTGLGREARSVLAKFRPATLGQAGRLAGVTPADIMLLTVAMSR